MPTIDRPAYTLSLNAGRDGVGYFYGDLTVGECRYRIDVMPPRTEPKPYFVMRDVDDDPTRWIVYVDGEEIARVATRTDVEPLLVTEIVDQLDIASSASRQHFIDTGRYLRK